jgi:hypothetical protein
LRPWRFDDPTERIAAETVSSGRRVLMRAPPRPADPASHQSSAVGAPDSPSRPSTFRTSRFHGVEKDVTSIRRVSLT